MEKQLPKNWVKVLFEEVADVTDFVANGSFQSLSENVIQTEVPDYAILVRLKDHSSNWKGNFRYVTKESYNFLNKSSLVEGDLFIANVGYPGKLFLVPNLGQPMTIGPNGLRIRANESTSNRFLAYYYSSAIGKEQINNIVSGSAQQKFNKTGFRKSIIPLPPLPEQNRIVIKLDALFAQLETIKSSMANVPLLLKDFRQQVLTQAVTGKLTEEWRKRINMKDWNEFELKEIIKVKSGNSLSANVRLDGNIPVYGGNGVTGFHNDANVFEEKIVIGRVGFYCGSVHITPALAWITDNALIVEKLKETNTTFLYLLLKYLNLGNYNKSTAQPVISGSKIYSISVKLPLILEQQEIVSRVESLFAKADAIEKQYKILKAEIDNLPQALLHKAFKGELTEQLESDGDARELLKEIEELKAKVEKDKRKKSKDNP